jgi:phosphotriesterase-related protein
LPTGQIQTVLGPIEPDAAGFTLTHEHLLCSLVPYAQPPGTATEAEWVNKPITADRLGWIQRRKYVNREVLKLHDEEVALSEARMLAQAGGGTVVDVTSRGIGRDPLGLSRISRASGLNIVMGASYYVPPAHPSGTAEKSDEELYAETLADVTTGVGDTGVRAGVIGEIGIIAPIDDLQTRILQAAVAVSLVTGCPISIHPPLDDAGALDIMRVLLDAGADPTNIIMGHLGMAMVDRGVLAELAATGCYLQYDHFGSFEDSTFQYSIEGRGRGREALAQNDDERIATLGYLIELGAGDRLLAAQDVCIQVHLRAYGGKGYDHLITNIVPRMRQRGFSQDAIDKIFVGNPARALAFKAPSV